MKQLFTLVVVGHGLIHLMGPAKAFGLAKLPQLTQPISKGNAVVWLLAAGALLATAGAISLWPRWWWVVGAVAICLSQAAISTSWNDAKYGTIANALILAGVVLGYLSSRAASG